MLPLKHPVRFLLVAAGIYALLMIPATGLDRLYGRWFRGLGNVVFARFWFWPQGSVRFLDLRNLQPGDLPPGAPPMKVEGARDTLMELRKRGVPTVGYMRTSSRYVAYGPVVTVAALVMASPWPWRRRVAGAALALLFVHAFIVLRLTLTLLATGFAAGKPYSLFSLSPAGRAVLERTESLLADDPTLSFVVPVGIWLLVALLVSGIGMDQPSEVGSPARKAARSRSG